MPLVYDHTASPCFSFSLPALPSPTQPPSASLPPVPFTFYGDESTLRVSASSALVLETYLKYTHLASVACGRKPRRVAAGGSLFQATMEVEDEDDNGSATNEDDTTTLMSELFLQYSLLLFQDAVAEAEALAQEEEAFWEAMDMNIDAAIHAGDTEPLQATCQKELQDARIKQERGDEPRKPSSLPSSSSSTSAFSSTSSSSSSTPILSSGAVPRKHSALALRPLHIWLLESIPSSYTSSSTFSSPCLDLVFPSCSSSTTIALSRASGLTPTQITTFFENYRYKHLSPLMAGTRKPASFYEVILAFKMNLPLTAWLTAGGKRKRALGREEGGREVTRGKEFASPQRQPQRQQRRKNAKKGKKNKKKKKKKKKEEEEEDTDEEEMEEVQEGENEVVKEEGFYRRLSARRRTPPAPLVGGFLYGKEAEEEEEEEEKARGREGGEEGWEEDQDVISALETAMGLHQR
ncbi:hypothetical protein VYU27_004614 [Nannochloropsis oceanica]